MERSPGETEELIMEFDLARIVFAEEEEEEASIVVSLKDVTERQQAEEALRESEAQKKAILDGSVDRIRLVDRDLRIIWANKTHARALSRDPEDLVGKLCYTIFVDRDSPCPECPSIKAITSGRTEHAVLARPEPVSGGERRYLDSYAVPIKDDAGEIVNILNITRDITAQVRAEQALRESEAEKKAILDGITTNMRLVNEDLEMLWVNKAAAASVNKSSEEMVGHTCYEFWGDDPTKPCPGCPAPKVLKTKETQHITRHTPDGKVLDLRAEPVFDDKGNLVGVVEIAHDITDKSRLEDQLQRAEKMEVVGTLAGGVAHDLNNILSGLVSYPELLLLEIPEESPLRNPILTIQKSGEKAAAIVQDLLTLARRGVAVTEVVNLNLIISEYVKSPEHERLISFHPNVHARINLEGDLLNILGSPAHLSKTVMNLVSNAAEAMTEGGTISISTENRYIDRPIRGYDSIEEGDYVILTVSDTGVGILPTDMERIFEPFYTKKVMGRSGTGLGMAVVWGTVKDHKGYIDVQSTEGKGTAFTLYFPVTRKEIAKDKALVSIDDYMGRGESILVVDDVEEQREIASKILKKLGYSVSTVSSGEEAVGYLKDNSADLLILDMIMDPGIDGLDTYKRIIEFHPKQKALIVSGFSETKRVKKAQKLGAGAYVKKPFLLEKIGIAVRDELDK